MEHQGRQSCDHTGHGLLPIWEELSNELIVSFRTDLRQAPSKHKPATRRSLLQ